MMSSKARIKKIDDIAKKYHKTQNEQLKSLWYEEIKQWAREQRRLDEIKRSTTHSRKIH
tara:strand:- start:3868 stop:4044 length:177 start_codon:yes stop_codon:yes gene_type:complete